MLRKMNFAGCDEKVRKYLLPAKVLKTWGRVSNEANLLEKKSIQISTNEAVFTILENDEAGENASVLLDFGFEFSGGAKILTAFVTGENYPSVRLCFGESVGEAMSTIGYKNALNDHSTRDMKIQLTPLSDMEFGQTGFRFLKIELLSKNTSIQIKSILGIFAFRDLEYKGSFECSDDRLNRIFDISAYTCHLNMQSMLWDGIKRDRLVWIGDTHPEMLTIRTIFGYHKIVDEGLQFSIAQCPLPAYPNNMVTYAMWWLVIQADWYQYHGQKELILPHSAYITELLKQLCSLVSEDGTDSLSDIPMGYFLDWQSFGKAEAMAGVRGLFSWALSAGEALCDILKNDELKVLCAKSKLNLLKNEPKDKTEYAMKQAAAMLYFGGYLNAKKASEEVILPGEAAGMSTFMSYYILTALAKGGYMEQALSILSGYYGAMLDAGATTFWEDFDIDWLKPGASIETVLDPGDYDIHGENGAHCYQGFRHSLCHGWASGPAPFLAESVLGIKILAPGCKKVGISPDLGTLTYAKGTYPTPYGVISVSHTLQPDGSIKTDYTSPKEIEIVI